MNQIDLDKHLISSLPQIVWVSKKQQKNPHTKTPLSLLPKTENTRHNSRETSWKNLIRQTSSRYS